MSHANDKQYVMMCCVCECDKAMVWCNYKLVVC